MRLSSGIRPHRAHRHVWLASGRDVYVYFNNDAEGYAIDNARQLIEAVGAP